MAVGADTPIRFGISVLPNTEDLDRIRELVGVADRAGLDLVGIQDHPYQRRFLDTWSLIPALFAETERISICTDVANLPLRPPAVMAKAAATLDVLAAAASSSASAPAATSTRSSALAVRGEPRASPWRRSTRRST